MNNIDSRNFDEMNSYYYLTLNYCYFRLIKFAINFLNFELSADLINLNYFQFETDDFVVVDVEDARYHIM